MKRWSTREIARRAGVSPATVSRVMNGQGNVTPELAERVRAVLRSMQGEQRSGATLPFRIGIAIPRRLEGYGLTGDSFYGEVLSAIDAVMREEGHELVLCPYGPEQSFDVLLNQTLSRYDGLILMGADTPEELAREGVRRKLPMVVLDKHVHGVDSVVSDNVGGAEGVTGFVLSRGYRHLAYLCETLEDVSFAARARGFTQAITASGRSDLQFEICEVGRGWLRAQQVLEHLIETYPFPLAIVAGNDMTALHILALARAKGIAVPEELGLVGFDDVPLASMAEPALTTVRVDKAEMGRLAARRLLERITRPDMTPVTTMMHVFLVVRSSTV